MLARAWRLALVVVMFVSALVAAAHPCAATTTPAAPTPAPSPVSPSTGSPARVEAQAPTRKLVRRAHRGHRARRPPPGGVYARCAVVMDPVSGQVLYEKNADLAMPIASITKLMTAVVFLEQKPDLEREVEVTREELYHGGHSQLRNHEVVPLVDLLHMSLMCSDNVATRVLARESGLTGGDFLARMNSKTQELGLKGTRFVDPTGLDQNNVSTASDVARLLQTAAGEPLIHSITTTSSYEFSTGRR